MSNNNNFNAFFRDKRFGMEFVKNMPNQPSKKRKWENCKKYEDVSKRIKFFLQIIVTVIIIKYPNLFICIIKNTKFFIFA